MSLSSTGHNTNKTNPNDGSFTINPTQLQRKCSQTNSPLIPRRNDYEPVARVTIQRQQRVCDISPRSSQTNLHSHPDDESTISSNTLQRLKNLPNRPLTLDLKKAFNKENNSLLSTTSTPEDEYITNILNILFLYIW